MRHTHLCQSGLLVADFVFADGRQLLQRVAVVGERPRQPSELGPSCRNQTSDTASVRIWWELGGRQRNTTPIPSCRKKKKHKKKHTIRLQSPGTVKSCKIFPQLSLIVLREIASGATHSLDANLCLPQSPDTTAVWRFHSTPAACTKVSLNTSGPPAAAGLLLRSCPLSSDLGVRAPAEGDSLLQGINTATGNSSLKRAFHFNFSLLPSLFLTSHHSKHGAPCQSVTKKRKRTWAEARG